MLGAAGAGIASIPRPSDATGAVQRGMSEVLAVSAKPKFDLDQGLPGAVKQLWDSPEGVDALEPNLSFQIFRAIIALDYTDNRHSIRHDRHPARPLAGSARAMDIFGFRGEGR